MLGTIVVRHERSRSYGAALKSDFRKALELGAGVIDALDVNFELHPYLVDELEYCFHAAFCIPTQFEAIEAAEVLSLLKSSSLGVPMLCSNLMPSRPSHLTARSTLASVSWLALMPWVRPCTSGVSLLRFFTKACKTTTFST